MTLKKPIPFHFNTKSFEAETTEYNNQLKLRAEVLKLLNPIKQLEGLEIDFKKDVVTQIADHLEKSESNTMKLPGLKLMDLYNIKLPGGTLANINQDAQEPNPDNHTKFITTSEQKTRFTNFQNLKQAFENYKEINNPHPSALVHAFPNQIFFSHVDQTIKPNTDYILGNPQRQF
jgi:hypothetical protein